MPTRPKKNLVLEGAISLLGGVVAVAYGLEKSTAYVYQRRIAGGFRDVQVAYTFMAMCKKAGMTDLQLTDVMEPRQGPAVVHTGRGSMRVAQ